MSISKKLSALTVLLAMVATLVSFTTVANANTNETIKITGGNLTWGYKHSWRTHMEMPIMSGPGITTGNGVIVAPVPERTAPDYGYKWTNFLSGRHDDLGALVEFSGSLKYQKYMIPPSTDYLVDTTIQDLSLNIAKDGTTATLIADVTYRKGAGVGSTSVVPLVTERVDLATVDLSASPVTYNSNTVTVTNAPTVLTEQGGAIVGGSYGGQAGDPVSFTLNIEKQSDSVTPPSEPSTDEPSTDEPSTGEPSTGEPTPPAGNKAEFTSDKNAYTIGENVVLELNNVTPDKVVVFYLETKNTASSTIRGAVMSLANILDVTELGKETVSKNGTVNFTAELNNVVAGQYSVVARYEGEDEEIARVDISVTAPAPGSDSTPAPAPAPAPGPSPTPISPILLSDKEAYIIGENVVLTLKNATAGTNVDFYLGTTKLGTTLITPEGTATFTTKLENIQPGNHTFTVKNEGQEQALAELTIKVNNKTKPTRPNILIPSKPISPAQPANEKPKEEPRCVKDVNIRGTSNGVLNWAFKRSFYGYILSNAGGHGAGKITPAAGASLNNGIFTYPVSHPGSMVNVANKTARINFGGYFNFYKHNGVLNLTLSNPSLVVTGANTGYLELSVSSTDMTGKPVVPGRVRFADVTFSNLDFSQNSFKANTSSVTLTAQGAKAFAGFYKAGTQLDNFNVDVILTDKVTCYDANGNPVLASTGINNVTFITLTLLSLIGITALVFTRKIG